MRTGLDGLTVWITGASGGIGRALARTFAEERANLVLQAGSNLEPLQTFARAEGLEDALCVQADVRDETAVGRVVEQAGDRFGGVDVVVVNAGIWPPEHAPLHRMSRQRMEDVLSVNLLGAMVCAGAFLKALAGRGPREDGRGASICFVGSTAGRFGEAGHSAYAATKAGLRGLVRTLKNEIVLLDPYGRVNMVEPGWTVTPMAEAALEEPGVIEGVVATMPVRALARPEDIARSVAVLSAPALSRHTSGEIVTVAGGMEGRKLWSADQVDPASVRARLREKD